MEKKRISIFSVILTIIEIAAILIAALRFIAPDLFKEFRPACAFVVSDSMQPVLTPGTFVTLKSYHVGDELEVGDIITYLRSDGKTIIHRVTTIDEDYVITKGDNNSISDPKVNKTAIRGIVKNIYRVDSEKIQSIVRNYYAKDNNGTRKAVSIGVITLAAALLVSSIISDNKDRKKAKLKEQEAEAETGSGTGTEPEVEVNAAADVSTTDEQINS